jgi:hypothetical protein
MLNALDCKSAYGNCDPDYGCNFAGACIDSGDANGGAHCKPQ